MQFLTLTVLLSALTATMGMPGTDDASPYALQNRQVADAMQTQNLVRGMLNSARSSSVGRIRRRRLQEARERRCIKQPSGECEKCMDSLVIISVGEVMVCGVAALGISSVSGGSGAVLAASGFIACEVVVWGSYEKSLVECRAF